MSSKYDVVIGLEIHAQLATSSKCFSGAASEFSDSHNNNVSLVCAGMPGTLPTLNSAAVRLAVKTGLALNCEIQEHSQFDRKQYFYPDMPKGYQITQLFHPIALGGRVPFFLNGEKRQVELERAHMEEDAGRSTHHGEYTLINLNRAGVPLLEIVSKPVMTSPEEAAAYARAVRQILKYAGVSDGNLEQGSMRCDCNISIKPKGALELGVKVELKNLNSFRFIEKALHYEINRQIQSVEMGEEIVQETRLYDSIKNKTFSMRSKEGVADYRYFPEPDLLPLVISREYIESVRQELGEPPAQRVDRFMDEFQLSLQDAELIASEKEFADYYERLAELSGDPKASCHWMTGELTRLLNESQSDLPSVKFSIEAFASLLRMVQKGTLSGKMAKNIFEEMWSTGQDPDKIVDRLGLALISDNQAVQDLVDQVLKANQSKVAEFQQGKEKLYGFFVGQVMKLSRGQADPGVVNQLLKASLHK